MFDGQDHERMGEQAAQGGGLFFFPWGGGGMVEIGKQETDRLIDRPGRCSRGPYLEFAVLIPTVAPTRASQMNETQARAHQAGGATEMPGQNGRGAYSPRTHTTRRAAVSSPKSISWARATCSAVSQLVIAIAEVEMIDRSSRSSAAASNCRSSSSLFGSAGLDSCGRDISHRARRRNENR